MAKKTDELDFELENTDSIEDFLNANEAEFDDKNFYSLLNTLIAESGKSKFKIAADSGISEPYMYNLVKKEKRPMRDTVIKLSFGLKLSVETTERLLKLSGYSGFYVRHKRDAILKFAVEHDYSLLEADVLLGHHGFSIMPELS